VRDPCSEWARFFFCIAVLSGPVDERDHVWSAHTAYGELLVASSTVVDARESFSPSNSGEIYFIFLPHIFRTSSRPAKQHDNT
jgi:hypothetical protein